MYSSTLDRAVLADPAEVVAPEVDEHHVLGALLRVGEQRLGLAAILLLGGAARVGAGDRPRLDPAPADLDQRLGRGAGDLEVAELEEVHVGRRVDRAQAAVDRERLDRRRRDEALRRHDLEGVAGVDVLDDPRDVGLEVLAGQVRAPRDGGLLGADRGCSGIRSEGGSGSVDLRAGPRRRHRAAQRVASLVDHAERAVVGGVDLRRRRRRTRSRARSPRGAGGRRRASARRPSATCRAARAGRGSARPSGSTVRTRS